MFTYSMLFKKDYAYNELFLKNTYHMVFESIFKLSIFIKKNQHTQWRWILRPIKNAWNQFQKTGWNKPIYHDTYCNDIIYIIVIFSCTIITLLFIRFSEYLLRILGVLKITAISIVFKITKCTFQSLKIRLIWFSSRIGSISAIWRWSEDQGFHQIHIRSIDAYWERICRTK